MHNYKELEIWKKSRKLVSEVYHLTSDMDDSEKYTLLRQIKRSSISIPSNIAEGCGRGTDKQLSHFLDISIGSACELETQLLIASDLKFIKEESAQLLLIKIEEIKKMIFGFKKSLRHST